MTEKKKKFIPALGYNWLTNFYDLTIKMPETSIPYVGWIAKFLNTEDNVICIMQYDNQVR